ncbi:MAG: hypothetical protein ACYC6L_18320 [Anaerolineae bacterium]
MSSLEPIQNELKEVQQNIQAQNEKRQKILHEIELEVKARMTAGQKKLRFTLPIGIVIGLALWGFALWMNLSQNTGKALETYPCAVPIFLVILGIIVVVVAIWLGIPKEGKIRKDINDQRATELDEVKQALSPLTVKERQLKAEIERLRYQQR